MEPVKEKIVDKLSDEYKIQCISFYTTFLGEVFQATSDSGGNVQIVYPILFANQDKLNDILVGVYQSWANYIFSQFTPELAPHCAEIFVNVSDLIEQFPLGNRASNLDMAIIGYKLALNIFTRDDFPQSWARTQNNLGNAYSNKIIGNRAENIDEAISCYQLALEVYTHADFSQSWAMTHNNLGLAYSDEITGNPALNIDEAISCYQLALEVYTRDDFSQSWGMIHNNLGNAYLYKITGNRAENIDEAISYYQKALEVRTRADFPEKWAMTQNNLGLTYWNKITGDRAKNLHEAINCYQLALEIYTHDEYPEKWADIQNNLEIAYNQITNNQAENIDTDVKILELQPEYLLNQCAEETGLNKTELNLWIQAIHRKKQAILQGPPGTGKTFIAEKLAKHLIGGGDGFSGIIQFHPAYTYEDFIEGLRPITQDGQLTYSIVPGRFLGFCKLAEAREDTCVLIIDEINRANLSQVFGELMYLLDDRDRTVKLASGQLFRIPTNVRIIGTMNTADRSIALVDNALRRRFAFIPIYPNYEVLRQYHHREKTGFPVDKLTRILENVNRAINNKHYELGISFFLTKTLAEDIQDIWQMEIEPYLEEYFFDNQAKMDELIWDNIKDEFSK